MAAKKTVRQVIVRAYSGVFVGELVSQSGGPISYEVEMVNVRHVWSWSTKDLERRCGTVEDLAILGAGAGTRISGPAPRVLIADVKVIADLTPLAAKRFDELPCLA